MSSTQRRERLWAVRTFMERCEVPADLATTIRGYYEYLWETNHVRDDDLFADLSPSLQLRLTIAVKRRFINDCGVFANLDQDSVVRLVVHLDQVVVVPDEVVAAEGEIGTAMYFVARGHLLVTVADPRTGATVTVGDLGVGSHFGEAAILEPEGRRNATVRAVSFCELHALRVNQGRPEG